MWAPGVVIRGVQRVFITVRGEEYRMGISGKECDVSGLF